jgi:hypothetical protein
MCSLGSSKLQKSQEKEHDKLQILEVTKNWDWRSWNPPYLVLNCTSWSRRPPTQCKIPCNNHRPIVTSNSYHERNQNAPEYSESSPNKNPIHKGSLNFELRNQKSTCNCRTSKNFVKVTDPKRERTIGCCETVHEEKEWQEQERCGQEDQHGWWMEKPNSAIACAVQ